MLTKSKGAQALHSWGIPEILTFYSPWDKYGYCSNFSRHPVRIFGYTWPTSEHAFQAMKFHPHRPDLVDEIARAGKPGVAALLGRDTTKPLRTDWDSPCDGRVAALVRDRMNPFFNVDDGINRSPLTAEHPLQRTKDMVMYVVLWAKFTQNEGIKAELLSTGNAILIEDAVADPYWGQGPSKVGENKLGRQLMCIREAIRTGRGRPAEDPKLYAAQS